MILIKTDIDKIFTKIETPQENVESVDNVDTPKVECKEYVTKECDNNLYVEVEKDKYVLEFHNLGVLHDINGAEVSIYTPHMIDLENRLYGRYKLDDKKVEQITCKDNFTYHSYIDHLDIVKSYKHFK